MLKKKSYIIGSLIFIFFGIAYAFFMDMNNGISPYVGEWEEAKSSQFFDGAKTDPDPDITPKGCSSFFLTIKEDGSWICEDTMAPSETTTGKIEKYKGDYCIYPGDDFRFVLRRGFKNLIVDVQYLKGNDYPPGEIVYRRR